MGREGKEVMLKTRGSCVGESSGGGGFVDVLEGLCIKAYGSGYCSGGCIGEKRKGEYLW